MNEEGHESGIDSFTDGRVQPVLQDSAEVGAWESWGVAYRDVVILDGTGTTVGVYNLTDHDLSDEGSRADLTDMLESAR